jgi:hypothetical protein
VERYPKAVWRNLRDLVGLAYEVELGRELGKLAEHFDEWREGKIDAFDLTELVHKYHQGPARELWKRYADRPMVEMQVASAIARGILRREDVPEETWPYVEELIERYRFGGEGGTA